MGVFFSIVSPDKNGYQKDRHQKTKGDSEKQGKAKPEDSLVLSQHQGTKGGHRGQRGQ